MKTSTDPRHLNRIKILKDLFSNSFYKNKFTTNGAKKIWNHLGEIDQLIKKVAKQWPIDKIAKIDLAILRLALFELQIEKKNPPKVTIDEAVELAKEFGGDECAPFINGVLGTVMKSQKNKL